MSDRLAEIKQIHEADERGPLGSASVIHKHRGELIAMVEEARRELRGALHWISGRLAAERDAMARADR